MSLCLNPSEPHTNANTNHNVVCAVAQCGFLLEGAAIERWRIERLLRVDGVKKLFLASSALTGERMMVKVISGYQSEVMRVLQPLAILRHPNIQQVWHMEWLDETQSIVLVESFEAVGSLARIIGLEQKLTLPMISNILLQIAQGLQHAHQQNIVHGTVKPENCLITATNTVRIGDFYHGILDNGSAYSARHALYQAPEQEQGVIVPATDQYALALMVLQLLEPHVGGANRLAGPQLIAQLPRAIQRVISTALQADPMQRFPNILAFAREFHYAMTQPTDSAPQNVIKGVEQRTPVSPLIQIQPPSFNEEMPTRLTRLSRLPGHTEAVTAVKWASDGVHLASAGLDRSVQIWQVRNHIGTPLATLTGYQGEIAALSWSPDSTLLATAGKDAALRVWNVTLAPQFAARVEASWWGHDGAITALEWSPRGGVLASGGRDQVVRLWNVKGQEQGFLQANKRGVSALAWSPDGRYLASGGNDKHIHVWDVSAGSRLYSYTQHNDEIGLIRWSANGTMVASCGRKKETDIHIWDPWTAQTIGKVAVGREIVGMAWASDASWIAAVTFNGKLCCWRVERGTMVAQGVLDTEGQPLTMDMNFAQKLIALGTAEMTVMLQKWNM